jgi:hypothetical protein
MSEESVGRGVAPGADSPPGGGHSARRPTSRIGRPPKLTPKLRAELLKAIRQCGWLSPAARRCGVSMACVKEWVERGRGMHPTRPATALYASFAADVEKAQAEWESSKLALIDDAARTKTECWTAAAWSLERFNPEAYGRRDHLDVSGTVALVQVRALLVWVASMVERYVPAERRDAELADLAAVAGELGGGATGPPRLAQAS